MRVEEDNGGGGGILSATVALPLPLPLLEAGLATEEEDEEDDDDAAAAVTITSSLDAIRCFFDDEFLSTAAANASMVRFVPLSPLLLLLFVRNAVVVGCGDFVSPTFPIMIISSSSCMADDCDSGNLTPRSAANDEADLVFDFAVVDVIEEAILLLLIDDDDDAVDNSAEALPRTILEEAEDG